MTVAHQTQQVRLFLRRLLGFATLAKLSESLRSQIHGLRIQIGSKETPAQTQGRHSDAPRPHEGICDNLAGLGALLDQQLGDSRRLLSRIPAMHPWNADDVGDSEIVQPAFPFLEKQY